MTASELQPDCMDRLRFRREIPVVGMLQQNDNLQVDKLRIASESAMDRVSRKSMIECVSRFSTRELRQIQNTWGHELNRNDQVVEVGRALRG